MKNFLAFLAFSFLLSSCTVLNTPPPSLRDLNSNNTAAASRAEEGMPSKPGSCFAKCLIPDQFNESTHEFAIYTGGDEKLDIELDTIQFEKSPETTEWKKTKADKNCLSANPEDCLVWCLVTIPAELKTLVVVKDTSLTNKFLLVNETRKEFVKQGGFTEWREVICDNKLSKSIKIKIQEELTMRGYDPGSTSGFLDKQTRTALEKFQKDNGYPVGQLDFESLDGLGVEY